MRDRLLLLLLTAALVIVPATLAEAQGATGSFSPDPYTRWNGVRDKVGFQVGTYFVTHSTFARLQPRGLPSIPGLDLESDILMPDNTTDFRVDGYLRLGKRHRIRGGFWNMNRDVVETLTARVAWGDEVYEASTQIGARWDTRVIKADYRYSIFQGERYDIGAALGFFIMRVDTGIGLAGETANVATDTKKTAPLPMIGLDVEYQIAPRWMLRGHGQYFAISLDDTVDGKWWEARAAVEFVPLKNFGLGLGYNFARVDLDIRLTEGRIAEFEYNYKINGPHLYLIASF